MLLGELVRPLVPNGPLMIGVDETLQRRWGKKIAAEGIHCKPVRSTQEHVWALPLLSVLAPSERYAAQRGEHHK